LGEMVTVVMLDSVSIAEAYNAFYIDTCRVR
jgi:hypothetical protein